MTGPPAVFAGPRYYDDCLGAVLFEPFARELARRLPRSPGGDVLETACGTAIVTAQIRERLDPSVDIVATDLSKAMLDYGRAKLGERPGIEWREVDASRLPFADGAFAAVVCGFGIMFMPDPVAALREARRVLVPAGSLVLSVWDRIEENPHALANAEALESMFPDDPQMRFRFPYEMADETFLRGLLSSAGFGDARIERRTITLEGVKARQIAIGQVRGTPRASLIEARGVSLETVIDRVTERLVARGGDPYHASAQAVIVQATAI